MKTESTCLHRKFRFARGTPSSRFISHLTSSTYALVLAGSRKHRLQELTDCCAVSAVPFGGKFRIIDFTLSNCVNSGIRHIGVATQYCSHDLIRHIKNGWSILNRNLYGFVDLLPAQQHLFEAHGHQGVADVVLQNQYILRKHHPEFVLILPGDHVYKMDYGKLLALHVESGAEMSMVCTEAASFDEQAMVVADENLRVIRLGSQSLAPVDGHKLLTNMGIYVFNSRFLFEQLKTDTSRANSGHDFCGDMISYLIENKAVFCQEFGKVRADNNAPYWRDIASIDAYWEANMELTHVTPELNVYDKAWPIWSQHEQFPPSKFVFDDEGMRGTAVDSLVSDGCIISGAMVRRSLLFYNVRVECFSQIEDSVLLPNVCVGRNVILRKVIVEKNCRIPDGFEAGIDPEKDSKYFFVSPGGVTLITSAALLSQEQHEFDGRGLLSDAKAAENLTEQIICRKLSGDAA